MEEEGCNAHMRMERLVPFPFLFILDAQPGSRVEPSSFLIDLMILIPVLRRYEITFACLLMHLS